ncbi:MAG: TIGR00730 family Rossman fold protein [Candidatus Omnitrophica bacterium CG12_big_fil_rev_8_21_14_0_65_43_15]|uniref:AMP nucleosidase n=1 Tax=Candidatus Taenaricola geysiri TaxID=1974752 RepID=A0A2J0LIY0_9BACT|nr:MAG: TIGR00730 family Rossman fold protein [Candidatus Omnitrophica bacterium CG03_land_8_20_14_0_80_43_22]PIW66804.1 MAG: TIGR00730 family Rossman fold protein [Candidatus Omnitrophica bacterium CG12_big_fil_rev_8_21_14_0_65_43_15]PIW80734.1 MAG: TIGR00730 family Rossman fold protein [Candidatus Omnitrophica bacterium CG_4_8_14_3_um_filter_43_15]PIY83594.1 MAG: TIGR00730 family Rossman fold protein [Candidatus Omnitrophica bacterium CG_4_10_14_0_8_um_filter_43_18]PJC46159.1 MAG: TIGR00730 f
MSCNMRYKNKKPYKAKDDRINDLIGQIAGNYASGFKESLMRDMLVTIAKIGEECSDPGDMKLINTTLKEFRYAFKVFSKYRHRRKVALFGSARTDKNAKEYKMAELFAKAIAKEGFQVITGSGPGIMEAGNKGAGAVNSFGVNIRVPFEQKPNPYIAEDTKLVNFKYFFARKLIFIKESDATALFPGGFGTMDEGFEVITLFQTGKCRPRPIIMLESKGGTYWKNWLNFVKKSILKDGYISKDELKIFSITNDVNDAVRQIRHFYKNYHSMRYINDITVIRLNNEMPDKVISLIKKGFCDILSSGPEKTPAFELETENNEHLGLPRIKMHFNRHDFGRFRELIDVINSSY